MIGATGTLVWLWAGRCVSGLGSLGITGPASNAGWLLSGSGVMDSGGAVSGLEFPLGLAGFSLAGFSKEPKQGVQ